MKSILFPGVLLVAGLLAGCSGGSSGSGSTTSSSSSSGAGGGSTTSSSGGVSSSSSSSGSSSSGGDSSSSSSSSSSGLALPPPPEPTPANEIPLGDRTFYVAPDGSNANNGAIDTPFATLTHAVSIAQPGDVIVMRGGVYNHASTISIGTNRNGTADKSIVVFAFPDETPILDFSTQPRVNNNHGIRLNASYWRIVGLTIRYAYHNGIRMDGSYNRLERLVAHNNENSGIHMAGTASNNLVLNCDSYRNFDPTGASSGRIGNNADGFSAKFADLGPGNRYYGNRSWENSDDGFDFWMAPNTILLENSWAFGNGDPTVFGYEIGDPEFEGGGNGFKLGGNYVAGNHIVIRNKAFDNTEGNAAKGFDHNNNTGVLTLIHNTAFNNGRNFAFPNNPTGGGQSVFQNNLSLSGVNGNQLPPGALLQGNSWQLGTPPTTAMLESIDTSLAKGPRQPDGSLPDIGLLRPLSDSVLVDGGVDIGLPFEGDAPDIGVYEYSP